VGHSSLAVPGRAPECDNPAVLLLLSFGPTRVCPALQLYVGPHINAPRVVPRLCPLLQYAFNLFSHNSPMDVESGYNEEELKMVKETRKIWDNKSVSALPTSSMPVFGDHHTERVGALPASSMPVLGDHH